MLYIWPKLNWDFFICPLVYQVHNLEHCAQWIISNPFDQWDKWPGSKVMDCEAGSVNKTAKVVEHNWHSAAKGQEEEGEQSVLSLSRAVIKIWLCAVLAKGKTGEKKRKKKQQQRIGRVQKPMLQWCFWQGRPVSVLNSQPCHFLSGFYFGICSWNIVSGVSWVFVLVMCQQQTQSVSERKKWKASPRRTKHNSTKPQGSLRPYFKEARGRI